MMVMNGNHFKWGASGLTVFLSTFFHYIVSLLLLVSLKLYSRIICIIYLTHLTQQDAKMAYRCRYLLDFQLFQKIHQIQAEIDRYLTQAVLLPSRTCCYVFVSLQIPDPARPCPLGWHWGATPLRSVPRCVAASCSRHNAWYLRLNGLMLPLLIICSEVWQVIGVTVVSINFFHYIVSLLLLVSLKLYSRLTMYSISVTSVIIYS